MASTGELKNINAFSEVKAHSSLVDYIAHTTGKHPKKVGSSLRFNPCPFCNHNDSFTVFGEDLSGYKCHSCDAKGDIFTFAEHYQSLSKAEALHAIAGHFGVQIPAPKAQGVGAQKPEENPLQKVLEAAVSHYRQVLSQRQDSLAYFMTPKPEWRGHTKATMDDLEVGFTDGRLAEALQAAGFPLDLIKQSGLYVEKKKDDQPTGEWKDFFMPGVFIFPHRTEDGAIGHFTIKDPRKRVDYQLKTEHRLNGLVWGNQRAIEQDMVILVEGENDRASFRDANIRNVMPSLGQVTDNQVRWLCTHSNGKRFVCWFDYDIKPVTNGQPPAGIKYTRKVYQALMRTGGCQVGVASAHMEPGEDPDDWIHKDLDSANKRIHKTIKKLHHPLLWELRVLPDDIRNDATAIIQWFEEISFFDFLGMVPDLQRDAIILELQKLGFSRDAVMDSIKQGYGLKDMLIDHAGRFPETARRSETYMRGVADTIWSYFKDRGKFFVNGDTLHLFYNHNIYQIGENTAWCALLHKEAELNNTTQLAKFVNAEIKANCFNRGDRMSSFSWIHTIDDGDGPMIFLNLKDPANRVLQLSTENVELIENGTNKHAVLLAESNQMKEFHYDVDVHTSAAMRSMRELLFDTLACDAAQKYLILSWALTAFLMPLSETKALMKMEGGSGSGKTTAAKMLSLLLYGDNMVGRSTTASDYAMGSIEPLIIKDNLETDDINKHSLNFLLLAATGAQNLKRESGSESGVTAEKLNCLVAITAIEPFSKPELINRTYIVDFSKKHQCRDFIETDAVMKLMGRRNAILSAWMQILADQVLPSLGDRRKIIRYIREQHGDFSKDRTTEFLSLMVLITRALLRYMPLSPDLHEEAGDRPHEYVLLDAWISYQNTHAKMTEQGTNSVLQLLEGLRRVFLIDFQRQATASDKEVWCPIMGTLVHREAIEDELGRETGKHYYWFECSTADLMDMMNKFGREYGVKVPFKNSRQLGCRINNEKGTLQDAGWSITHVKAVHGVRIAQFSWRDD